jgi:DNA-binding response OmpR family regulator
LIEKSVKECNIVYVEDDKMIRESVVRSLGRYIDRINIAENGQKGIESILKYQPDLVITDLEMPVKGGLEMIEDIREKHGLTMPIIVTTAYNDEEHKSRYTNDYILKPIRVKRLLERIEEHCSKE